MSQARPKSPIWTASAKGQGKSPQQQPAGGAKSEGKPMPGMKETAKATQKDAMQDPGAQAKAGGMEQNPQPDAPKSVAKGGAPDQPPQANFRLLKCDFHFLSLGHVANDG